MLAGHQAAAIFAKAGSSARISADVEQLPLRGNCFRSLRFAQTPWLVGAGERLSFPRRGLKPLRGLRMEFCQRQNSQSDCRCAV
jgi:hypothetical protein